MKKIICLIYFSFVAAYFISCGDDTVQNTEYQYTQIDSLFFQKDYDSVYIGNINPTVFGYLKIKVKKFRVSYDLYTNDSTDSTAAMIFNISDGHESAGNSHWGYMCNGYFELDHTFNKVLDSIDINFYLRGVRVPFPNGTYLLVKNLKAYKSY